MKLYAVLLIVALAASANAGDLKPTKTLRSGAMDVSKMTGLDFLGKSGEAMALIETSTEQKSEMKVTGGMDTAAAAPADSCKKTSKTYDQGARCQGSGYRKTVGWCCSAYGRKKGYQWK